MRLMLLALVALAGCAAQPQLVWDKPNTTAYDFDIDSGQCRAQAFAMPGASLQRSVIVYEACLQGKGWYQRAAY